MASPFRAFRRHGGRRVGTSALTIGLVTSLASLTLIVSGPAPAGANHNPNEATAEIHITKIVYGAAFPGPAGSFTTGGSQTAIPGFPASIPDGDTVSFEVAPGTYDITEVVGANDPPPHIFCAGRENVAPDPLWSVTGAVLTLAPTAGSVIACVFTNNIPAADADPPVEGEINVVKIVEDDPGDGQEFSFNLLTGDLPPFVPFNLGHGDTTRLGTSYAQINNVQGYALGEGAPELPYQYVSLTCGGNFGTFTGDGNTNGPGNAGAGIPRPGNSEFITCIYVNRFAAGLEVIKVLDGPPLPPGDLFGLDINGGDLEEFDVQEGTTGPVALNPGLATFGETARGTTDFDEYLTQISCFDRETDAPRQFTLAGDGRGGSIDLEAGADVVCVITNTWVELALVKDGPAQAPVGSTVTYDFTLINNSDNELTLSAAGDDVLGDLAPAIIEACGDTVEGTHVLAPDGDNGDVCQFSVDHVVGDLYDPLTNTVNVAYTSADTQSLNDFVPAAVVLASDTHTLDVFFPSVEIVKSGPAAAGVGDVIDYTFTITNTSTDGDIDEDPIPGLAFDSITDPRLPGLTVPADCLELATGGSCEFTAPYTVLDSDADPLVNEVDVHYHPAGYDDYDVADSDDHSVTLPTLGSLTVRVVGGDPDFVLTGPGVDEPFAFTVEPDGVPFTFLGVPAGEYTLDMTALEAGFVLDAIDCDPEETSVNLAAGIVVFDVADAPVTCTYTLSADDDGYDQYPGDTDFDFDTPFDDTDDDSDDPAPTVVAGADQNTNNGGPGSADPGLGAAGGPGSPAPAGDGAPQAVDQLPRTGSGLAQVGLMSGLLMILLGAAAILGARRRGMTQS